LHNGATIGTVTAAGDVSINGRLTKAGPGGSYLALETGAAIDIRSYGTDLYINSGDNDSRGTLFLNPGSNGDIRSGGGTIYGRLAFTPETRIVRNQGPKRLIAEGQGFCFLAKIEVSSESQGQIAHVYTQDGYWWINLSGWMDAASARCVGVSDYP